MNYTILTVRCKPFLHVVIFCYILDRPQLLKVVHVKESDLAVNYCRLQEEDIECA